MSWDVLLLPPPENAGCEDGIPDVYEPPPFALPAQVLDTIRSTIPQAESFRPDAAP